MKDCNCLKGIVEYANKLNQLITRESSSTEHEQALERFDNVRLKYARILMAVMLV